MRETRSSSPAPAPRAFDVQRELDEVVGPYEPGGGQSRIVRVGRWVSRALLVACLAIAVVLAIVSGLHSQLRDAQTAPAPSRPVTVQIVPAGNGAEAR